MAVGATVRIGAERVDEQIGAAAGDLEEARRAGPAGGDPRLDQVTGAVELVPHLEVAPALAAAETPVAVQVAVGLLGRRDELRRLLRERLELRVRLARGFPGERLEPLVDVRVAEDHAPPRTRRPTGGDAQVLERARLLELLRSAEERHLAVDSLPLAEKPVEDPRRRRGERPEADLGRRCRRHTRSTALHRVHPLPLFHGERLGSSKRFEATMPTGVSQVSTTDHHDPDRRPARPATMAHIAERAGVALSTVSYVLSGKRGVSPGIRERVLAAIEELNYRPHRSARALASGASHTIALFLPSPHWELIPVQQTFVAGAAEETSASDYALLLSTSPPDPNGIARLIEARRADGVILMETLAHDRRIERLKASGHPFTLIGSTADTSGISFVDLDFGAAIEKSLTHLHDLGHRCVALFNFPQDQIDAGYNAALIARDAFERCARRPRSPRDPAAVPAPGARGVRGSGRAAPSRTRVHRGDHHRLAVHRTARCAARGGPARTRRLLRGLGDRRAVRGDAHTRR